MIRDLRRAVLTHLKGDATITALVPAASIHPGTVPASPSWPFIRWDAPNSIPVGVGCTAGAEVTFFVHAFAKALPSETAESFCERITEAIRQSLHRLPLDLPSGAAKLRVRSLRTMMDGDEAGAWHGLVDCAARIHTS